MADPILVTRPSLPPLQDFLAEVEGIWERRWLTNRGPLHERFEAALATRLAAPHLSLMSNGMLALEAALAVTGRTGEVITTPYSFVATTHAVVRAGMTPVFADVEPGGFNIDPDKVEAAITERTAAILAVHCYGYPCDHERLAEIAELHGLALIYDAAHAFGVTRGNALVTNLGDLATISFHATKAFNSVEGGAVVSGNAQTKAALDLWRNFGIASETEIPAIGTNAKMNELCAAFGLLQLEGFDAQQAQRRAVDERYRKLLSEIEGLTVPPIPDDVGSNYSYFPLLVEDSFGMDRDGLYAALSAQEIYARRYFYPLLADLPSYEGLPSATDLPNARRAAARVLCLPIYAGLSESEQDRVVAAIRGAAAA